MFKIGDSVVCSAPMRYFGIRQSVSAVAPGVILESAEIEWSPTLNYPVTFCRECGRRGRHLADCRHGLAKLHSPHPTLVQGPFWRVLFPMDNNTLTIACCAEEWLCHVPY